jgi:DNA (cytosine-5)-methyltransferase 1
MTVKIGSLFAGIGGFELGLERSWVNAETVWQVEQEKFCQKILQKHWPKARIYNDVRDITKHNVEPVDVLIGGFPCQSISSAGKMEGLENENKSGLWWEMHRIASELRPRIIIMENVANILRVGGADVIGSLAQIGYDCEWTIISARQFGAPHKRERWFCVAYSNSQRHQTSQDQSIRFESAGERIWPITPSGDFSQSIPNTHGKDAGQFNQLSQCVETPQHPQGGYIVRGASMRGDGDNTRASDWTRCAAQPILCGVDDGIPNWMDPATRKQHNQRLQALGNAIVPQCSQWVGDQILKSGLLDDLLEDK